MVSEQLHPRQEVVASDWVGISDPSKIPSRWRSVTANRPYLPSGYGGVPVNQPSSLSGYGGAPADRPYSLSGYGGAPVDRPSSLSGYGGAPADRPYFLSGYGGGPNRSVVMVPEIVPGKIPKRGLISGKMTKSMARNEVEASDLSAVRQETREMTYRVDVLERKMEDLQNQMNRIEILVQRRVDDLRQSNLESIQGIQLMRTPEGNFKFPSTGPIVAVTGWGEDPLPHPPLASNVRQPEDPRKLPEIVQPGELETRDMAQINIISKRGVQIHGIPEGNSNSPSTGYSAVPNCWGQSQLPHAFVASPTLNKLNPNSEPDLARQWKSYSSNDRVRSFYKSLAKDPKLDSPEFDGVEPLLEAAVQKKETTMKPFTPGVCKYCGYKWFCGCMCKHYQQDNLIASEVALVMIPPEYTIGFIELKQDLAVVPINNTLIHEVKLVSSVKDKESICALAMNDTGSLLVSGDTERVVRVWDPGSESKNMKWGRIETSGHMPSFNIVAEDNVEIVSPQVEAERQLMQISVKIPSVGKNIKLNVKKSNSAVDVKAEIEQKVGILMNKQILLYTDRQLEDNQMLSQCDWRNGQTLHVLVCPTDKLCIFVNVRGERIISLVVKCCYTATEFLRPGVVVKYYKEGAKSSVFWFSFGGKQSYTNKNATQDTIVREPHLYAFSVRNRGLEELKLQLEVFFSCVVLRLSRSRYGANYQQLEVALEALVDFCRQKKFMAEIYAKRDCDLQCSNVFENLANLLSKSAFHVNSPLFSLKVLVLDSLVAVIMTTLSFSEVEEFGKTSHTNARLPSSTDTAVIMYTSGSTGLPKGVMITHGNVVATTAVVMTIVPKSGTGDVYLAYHSLAHVFELTAETVMLTSVVAIGYGSALTMTDTSIKIKKGTKGDVSVLKPTLMISVPAIMEQIRDAVFKKVGENFLKPVSRKWTTKNTGSATCKRDFVQFYYEPIKQIIKTCMNDQKDKLWPMLQKLGVTMKTDEFMSFKKPTRQILRVRKLRVVVDITPAVPSALFMNELQWIGLIVKPIDYSLKGGILHIDAGARLKIDESQRIEIENYRSDGEHYGPSDASLTSSSVTDTGIVENIPIDNGKIKLPGLASDVTTVWFPVGTIYDTIARGASTAFPQKQRRTKRRRVEEQHQDRGTAMRPDDDAIAGSSKDVQVRVCPPHPGIFGGLCFRCGKRQDEEDVSGVAFGYIHKGLKVDTSEVDRLRGADLKHLLRERKLVLILDLDHTLINSTELHDISAYENDLGIQTATSKDDPNRSLFTLESMQMLTKLRPFVHKSLEEASNMFEMYIYMKGDKAYAITIAKLLDSDLPKLVECLKRLAKSDPLVLCTMEEFEFYAQNINPGFLIKYLRTSIVLRRRKCQNQLMSEESAIEEESEDTASICPGKLQLTVQISSCFLVEDQRLSLLTTKAGVVIK